MPTAKDLLKRLPGAFKAEDFEKEGGGIIDPIPLTVARVETKEFDGREKDCLFFLETPKYIVMNRSRGEQLLEITGGGELVGQKLRVGFDPSARVNNRPMPMVVLLAP